MRGLHAVAFEKSNFEAIVRLCLFKQYARVITRIYSHRFLDMHKHSVEVLFTSTVPDLL